MRKFTFLLFALLFSFVGYSQFPTPGTEGFESTTGPDVPLTASVVNPSPWTLGTGATGNQWAVFDNGINVGANATRRWDRATTNFYAGSQAAFINRRQNGAPDVISEDYLATPLVTVPANGQLTFYTRTGFNITDQQVIDNLSYQIKVNTNTSAGSQTTLANYATTLQTWDNTTIAATYNQYEKKTVNLAAYAGQQVYIAFVRKFKQPTGSLSGNSWYVDDVKLVQRCIEPTLQTAGNFTTTTADLSWTPNGSTSWEIEVISSTGTPTGTGVLYSGPLPYVAGLSLPLVPLTPATSYVYYVRAKCSESDSNWVGPYNFTTATPGFTCAAPITISSLPYSTTDNTANYGDTYDVTQPSTCTSPTTTTNYMTGNDVFYSYTPTTSGNISITMTPGATWSGIFVYQGCANVGLTCVAGVANSGSTVRNIPSLSVTAGLPYIIVISTNATPQTVPYSLLIQRVNCPQPTALVANAINANGATLSWTNATSTSWQYVVQTAGSAVPSGIGITASTSTGTPVTGLNSDTAYQFWVRADCGDGTFSAWSGPQPFTTAIAPPVCGGIFVDAGGQAGNYPNNITAATGTYQICPNPGEQLTVTFTSFNTQLNNDLLKVYNGSGTSGTLLATYSGTTLPPAITSSSPDGCLTFVFTSNATTNAAGWVANVTCAPAPACQKPILLTAPAPTTTITYNSVSVGWTQNPNPDTTSPSQWEVIAVQCGSPAPTATSTGMLTTSIPFAYPGLSPLTCYNFYVRAVCSTSSTSEWSGPVSATTTVAPAICGGNFVDPGGIAGNYPNNVTAATGTTVIQPVNAGDQVTVTFTLLNTQLNNDLLKVYDGLDATGTLLATYSGVYTGAALPQITSSSPSGALTFVFTSNASTTAVGWLANITCAPAPACQKPILLTAPTANVAYNQVGLSWTQPASPDTSVPNLWQVLAVPCGSPAPTDITSTTTVGYQTNNNTTYVYPGLNALICYDFYVRALCASPSPWSGPTPVTTLVAPPICGGNFVDPGGVAANYPNNVTAATGTTTITPAPGNQVTVTFTLLNTQLNNDLLKVYDGPDATGTLLATYSGVYTGAALPQITSSAPDGSLTFVFTSNGTTTAAGWLANVTCLPTPACQKPILLTTGSILANSVNIGWSQTQNPDGSTPNQWQVYKVPCGDPAPTAITPTNVGVTVSGITSANYTGLNATTCYDFYVRSLCSGTSMSSWTGPISATTALGCGGQFVNALGTGAATYPALSDSTVTICPSTPGEQVTVTFTNFSTEATWDGLYVFDGPFATSPQIASANLAGNVPGGVAGSYWGTLTGANLPGPFISSDPSGCLTFRFRSDGLISDGGWSANITCAPAPTCSKPTSLTKGVVTGSSIVYNWTQPANPDGSTTNTWKVLKLPCNSPAPTASTPGWQTVSLPPGTPPTYTLTSLTTSTCYDFYVMAVCSVTDSSPIKALLGTTTTCGSQQASSTCSDAPPVCLLQGYCGNTSSQFAPPHTWAALTTAFSTCLGGASIENNSFINFQATSTTALFNIYVYNSLNGDGVQFFAFEANCDSPTVVSKGCARVTPTGLPGVGTPVSFQMTGLTPGGSYHLMFDGFGGDVCDYQVIPVNGVFTAVDVTPTAPSFCVGQSVILTASGGNNTYTWTPSTGLSVTTGTTVTASPTTTTTYTVTSSSTGTTASGCAVSKSVTVTVNQLTPPTIDFSYTTPVCVGVSTISPIPGTGFTTGGSYSSTTGLVINSTTGQIDLSTSLPGTYIVTYSIGSNPSLCQASNTSIATITINPGVTPLFLQPAPICSGATAPVLPLTSNNSTPITGTWNPPTVSNTASGTYTFTPSSGQCVSSTTLNVIVNTNCSFGSYASAVWLTNCGTSNFFNTVGSGTDIIGPAANVFPNANLGTYVQGSNALILRGAEVKTFKNPASNVCSARLNYRVFSGTPSGTFQVMDLPFFDNCGSGSFPISGGPCNTGDQKWQRVVVDGTTTPYSPVDLTAYPPGNYTIQVYYDISGSASSTSGCLENVLIDNNGAYYTATFTIQAQPVYTSANPSTCGGSNGSITISGMASNTTYSLIYNDDTTVVGPVNVLSNSSGEILISGLNSGTYSNFLVTINSCSLPNNTSIVLVDPSIPTVTVNNETVCDGLSATITATPGSTGTYSYVWTVPAGATDPGNVNSFAATVAGPYKVVITNTVTGCSSTSATGTLTLNPIIIPTFNAIAPICLGDTAPLLLTSSTNTPTAITGSWVPSVVDNTASGVYTFTPDSGQCSQPLTINVTVNSVPTPTATIVAQPTCVLGGTVQITSPLTAVGVLPTDLFISEVTDSNAGSLSYIEIYNGTGVSKNLSNYSVKTASNGGAYTFTLPLNNVTLASGSNYVVALGNDNFCPSILGGNGSLAAQSSTTGSVNFASNGNDHFALFNGATKIDSWGVFGSNNWAPSIVGTEGGDFRRKSNATHPSTTYNNNDWDIIDYVGSGICANNDYSNIAVYALPASATYQYNVDGGTYQSNTTFSGLTPGSHTFTVQNTATGCTSSITVTLDAIPGLPNITTSTGTLSACVGNTIQLIGSPSPATTNAWTSSNTSVATISNTGEVTGVASGTSTITYINTAGCQITETVTINALPTISSGTGTLSACVGNTIQLIGNGTAATTNAWASSDTTVATISSSGLVTGVAFGTSTITYTNSDGCQITATVTINALPTITTSTTLSACVGNTIQLTGNGTAATTNAWTSSNTSVATINTSGLVTAVAAGSSTITYVNSDGCQITAIVTINALPTITPSTTLSACVGNTIQLIGSPSSATTNAWTSSSTSVATINSTGLVTSVASGTSTITYTNSNGCQITTVVTINALPVVVVTGDSVCQGNLATISTAISPTGTYNYVWTVPSGASPGNVSTFTTAISGTYSVIATNTVTGCTSTSQSGVATISPAFSFTITDACVNNNFTLEVVPNANSFDVNTANFTWQYGGNTVGTNSSTFDVTSYLNSTTVVETLPLTFSVIVGSNGCQQTDAIVLNRIYCEIQKGISPNNDGKNENFDLRQMNVQQLSIYNRYGTKVYSKVEYSNEWVGQSDAGNELPDGTYYYVIEFKNNQASKTGWIYINRQN